MKRFIYVGILLSAFMFIGCGKNKEAQVQDSVNAEIKVEAETEMLNSEKEADLEEMQSDAVNLEQEFPGDDVIEELRQFLESSEELAASLEESMMQDPNLTQTDFNEKSQQMYEIWDSLLNEIWSILKRNLSVEDMKVLTAEQLEWIAMKEQSMKEAGAEVEGGSMYGMVVNQKGAELTKERVYELMKIVEGLD